MASAFSRIERGTDLSSARHHLVEHDDGFAHPNGFAHFGLSDGASDDGARPAQR